MVASREWFEYHLTPSEGWVVGSHEFDTGGVKKKITPSDRVLSLRLTEEISFSPPAYRWIDVVWTCGDKEEIDALETVHGRVPEAWKEYATLRKNTP